MEKQRKPDWLKIQIQGGKEFTEVRKILKANGLHTVCQEAACPNRMECYSKKTATFLLLGSVCTRNCTFCNVAGGIPSAPDPDEPENIAHAATELGLRHIVLTSVTRDDLNDGGSVHFAKTITALKAALPNSTVEVLIPDFLGDKNSLQTVIESAPAIINHNVETVPSLYRTIRPQAEYKRSIELIARIKEQGQGIYSKSGIMVGFGESEEEVVDVMKDLRRADCDFLTIGQYLPPSKSHIPVTEYVKPEQFLKYKTIGNGLGFGFVASAPFVRSSYNAAENFGTIATV